MPVLTLLCSKCGGTIELEDSREYGFCTYCGTKIIIEKPAKANPFDVEGLHRLILLNKDDSSRVKTYAEEIIRNDSKDPVAWYFLSLTDKSGRNDNAIKFGVKSCGGPKQFLTTIEDYLKSNSAGPVDSRVIEGLMELYPDAMYSDVIDVINKYSEWDADTYDSETIQKCESAIKDIEGASALPMTAEHKAAIDKIRAKIQLQIDNAIKRYGVWRRRRLVCEIENARSGMAEFRVQCENYSAMLTEKAPGKYTAEFTPKENGKLTIAWRLANETRTVNDTKKKWKVIPVPTRHEINVWHKGYCEVDPEWNDEVTLKFRVISGHITYAGGDAPAFKTMS